MGFLGDLAGAINSQFFAGENNNHTLDTVVFGQNTKYGSLGDFASKFDQSSERRYIEEGYLRTDPYNADPKQFEVLFQEPNATVFVKKRMFSSIAENFRPDFMDQDEKLYYRAMKFLFQNKCNVIAALERLSKIQQVTSAAGNISDQLVPIISTFSDIINTNSGGSLFNSISGGGSGGITDATTLSQTMDKVRRIYGFNTTNKSTTWVTDATNLFQSQFGQGTGVIEITNFTNLSTNVSVDGIKNPGSFNLTIVDPYESMLITDWDIEKAISDATNMFSNHGIFQFTTQSADQAIHDAQNRLSQLRAARGASPISLKIDPDTLLGKRVTAVLDRLGIELIFTYDGGFGGIGGGVNVSPEYLQGGAIAGFDGLSDKQGVGIGSNGNIKQLVPDTELNVFSNLINSVFNKMQLLGNSRNAFQLTNKATNYARKKLRFNFSGQLIIQPMDVVHIYMSSKSRYDNKLLSGLQNMFTGVGLLQNLDKTVTNLTNSITGLFNPSGNVSLQAEKSAYVGADFPNYLWTALRGQFINEKEGTHVFAGVVSDATDSWSDGKFIVNVNGRDNTAYFDQGKVNFKPGVDSFNGAIYDTLTPFKSNFDTITSNSKNDTPQLLDENIAILGTSQDKKGLLKAKAGPIAGQKVTSDTFFQGTLVDPNTGNVSKEVFAPDGLVYKWKEGIGVFVQFGNSLDLNDPNKVGNPNIAKEPFAGQDVMNVISLLITGKPYNYANYWRAASNIDGFGRDPQSQQDAAHSYISSLRNELVKSNTLWGNFIPFKSLSVDEQSFALAMQSQFRVVQKNKDLDAKLQKLADLNRDASLFGAASAFSDVGSSFNPQFLEVKAQLNSLQESIQNDIDNIQKADSDYNQLAAASGPDATFDSGGDSNLSANGPSNSSNANSRRELRRQLNYLTRRMSYNVRANEDKNLFIVDDYYDKDYDILAYEQSLTDGIKLYNNDFNSVRDKITLASDLLNLEVFADTQGHIRVRPPQYNRMPSSVFYKMMYLKQAYGIQIFPQFLSDIFGDQIDTLRKRIEIVEDMIRLDCAILNYGNDDSATQFIISSGATSGTGDSFSFISDNTGAITDINQLIKSSNTDPSDTSVQDLTSVLLGQAKSTKIVFSNSQRYSAIVKQLMAQGLGLQGYSVQNIFTTNNNSYVQTLISRIQTKSGQRIDKKDYISNNSDGQKDVVLPLGQTIDVFKVTKELQEKIQDRQKAIKLFYSAIKNTTEFKSLDDQSNVTGSSLLAPGIFGNSHVPEVYEHMIEDETYDDYGPGSGSRYIIKRAQIKNMQISVNPPDFTMVEVQGVLNTFAPNALPEGLNSFPDNGNGLVTAVAVDYDSWRNYGFKNAATIRVPFLSDPNSQCAPYASMILSRNRKNILRGNVTISGNEYMQPGEIVYLQDRQMLFYVTAVRHNFTFGSGFTTTLDLSYGHSPGEYIPTTLDIIGKMIYNNRDVAGYTIQRQTNSGNENNLGVVIKDPSSSGGLASLSSQSAPPNSFSAFNSQTLNNMMFTAAYTVNANNTKGNNITANVELRIYHDGGGADGGLSSFASDVKDILTGKSGDPNSPIKNQSFSPDNVNIVAVNLNDLNDRRSPSQKAIDSARNQVSTSTITPVSTDSTTPSASSDKIRKALFSYIVDCWLVFTQNSES
jgi:hypothetical protein